MLIQFSALLLSFLQTGGIVQPLSATGGTPYEPGRMYDARQPLYTAASKPDPRFPLRIKVMFLDKKCAWWRCEYFGHADLMAAQPEGIDFAYKCGLTFNSGYYQARWKEPDKKIELLLTNNGGHSVAKCTVNVSSTSKANDVYQPHAANAVR